MAASPAFELLKDIRSKAVELAKGGALSVDQTAGVKNIAYRVNNVNFFCDAEQVREVSTCEDLTVIPQTKRWLRGLVNSKGVLYSVTDLALFAGFDRPIAESRGHLLLLSDVDKQCAFLVNRVIGFRYFAPDQKLEKFTELESLPEGLASFVQAAYAMDDQHWFQLDVAALLDSEQFREVQ